MTTRMTSKAPGRNSRTGYARKARRRRLQESMTISALVAFSGLAGGGLLVATSAGENAMVNFVPAMWLGWVGLALGAGAALLTLWYAVVWLWNWR